jgi:gas vesicle protein
MNTTGKVLGGFLLGVAVGILVAPSSGNSTRRRLVRHSRNYSQHAIEAVRQYLDSLRRGVNKNAERIERETNDVLSAYSASEGTTSGPGLQGL